MKLSEIIKDVGKYHYIIVNRRKTLYLSGSNSKNEARKQALEKLQPIMDNVIGKYIYLITLRNVNKDYKEMMEEKKKYPSLLVLTGGPIQGKMDRILVVNNKKLTNKGGVGNNRFYFTPQYLENNKITTDKLEELLYDYYNRTGYYKSDFVLLEAVKV
jgi:hypothetical protein